MEIQKRGTGGYGVGCGVYGQIADRILDAGYSLIAKACAFALPRSACVRVLYNLCNDCDHFSQTYFCTAMFKDGLDKYEPTNIVCIQG